MNSRTRNGSRSVPAEERERSTIHSLFGRYITIFQAELISNLQNAHLAFETGGGRQIHICSDSKSVLQALENYTTKSKLLWDCFKALKQPSKHQQDNPDVSSET